MDLAHFFFINNITYTDALICPAPLTKEQASFLIQGIIWQLDEQEDWGTAGIEKAAHAVAEIFGVTFKKSRDAYFIRSDYGKTSWTSPF